MGTVTQLDGRPLAKSRALIKGMLRAYSFLSREKTQNQE